MIFFVLLPTPKLSSKFILKIFGNFFQASAEKFKNAARQYDIVVKLDFYYSAWWYLILHDIL